MGRSVSVGLQDSDVEKYFARIERTVKQEYGIARKARKMGLDPVTDVEISPAEDLAMRVEKLVGPKGVAERIRRLSKKYERNIVAIKVAMEIAKDGSLDNIKQALKTALAVLTEGVVVAPIEGLVDVTVGRNSDGSNYLDLYYAGPIRSAGGTAQALSVLIADILRRNAGIGRYVPEANEVERYIEEIGLYKNLQYRPTRDEIKAIIENCPVCINGEGTEDIEVSGNRDLPRVGTNKLRGGACLVIAEGLCLKASKLIKYVKELNLDGWDFLKNIGKKKKLSSPLGPKADYLSDVVGGRPILSHPSARGGFRLRYGRCRCSGLAAVSINPATMIVLGRAIAIGTQIKIERPGKAAIVTPCDEIEGPAVVLKNGNLVRVNDVRTAEKVAKNIKEIVDLGEILISVGEFLENNHPLMPAAYCKEWWLRECEMAGVEDCDVDSAEKAFMISEKYGVPLHPDYLYHWGDLSVKDVVYLSRFIAKNGEISRGRLLIPKDADVKRILEDLCVPHAVLEGKIVVEEPYTLLRCLGMGISGEDIVVHKNAEKLADLFRGKGRDTTLRFVSELAGVSIKDKAPTRIGVRVGRPEKARERKMSPPVHALFPVSDKGGGQRLLSEAVKSDKVLVDASYWVCSRCGNVNISPRCAWCGKRAKSMKTPSEVAIDLRRYTERVLKNLGMEKLPRVKGVKRLMSKYRVAEPLEKGILRAKHEIFVFKDGTVRYDITDAPLTHFRPSDAGLSVEKARELGYTKDIHGNELVDENQVVELYPQDIIIPKSAGDYLTRVANFIDDLLVKFYGLKPYYMAASREDLIGRLVIGLAPHTSTGVVGRIIGYTDAKVCYAHPFFHAAKRRNCDGDEDCIFLLLDGFLNFSRAYLPETRGGLMDAPLVLSTRINPTEIDKEAHHVDATSAYSLQVYKLAEKFAKPEDVEKLIDNVKARLERGKSYTEIMYTHNTKSISMGPKTCFYKSINNMERKLEIQLELATKIRAVDESDAAAKVIETHFIPDIMGNMRTYCTQVFRCLKCNTKYRRPPLTGRCTSIVGGRRCNGRLVPTVYEASVKKYMEMSLRIAKRYNVPQYTMQRLEMLEASLGSLFSGNRGKCKTLEDFLQ